MFGCEGKGLYKAVQSAIRCRNQRFLAQKRVSVTVSMKHGLRTADHGLRTTDCGLGIKYGLGIKRGLRTEYKTRTTYKMRTTD